MRKSILSFGLALCGMLAVYEPPCQGGEDALRDSYIAALKDAVVTRRLSAVRHAVKEGVCDTPMIAALAGALKDVSPEVRRAAAAALEKLAVPTRGAAAVAAPTVPPTPAQGTPPTTPSVAKVEPETPAKPAIPPAESHARESVPALIEAANDNDPATRAAIILALGTLAIGEAKALPILLLALKDPSAQMRVTAIDALHRFGAPVKDTQAAVLEAALAEKHPDVMNAFVAIAAESNPIPPELVPLFTNAVKGSSALRIKAFEALNRIGAKAVPSLIPLLKSDLVLVRREAAVLIEKYAKESPQIVPQLIPSLTDNDVYVRKAVTAALSNIGPDALLALPDLIKMLSSNDMVVRSSAANVIENLGPPAKDAVPALAVLMQDKMLTCRGAAGRALAKIGDPGRDELLAMLNAPRDEVRSAASLALATCGDSAMKGLADALKSDKTETVSATLSTLERMGGASDPAIVPVIPLLRHTSSLIRQSAISVLAKSGARAIKPLISALETQPDATPELRSAMTDALGRIGKDAIPPLLAIVGAKKEGPMLIAAIEALGKIGAPASDTTPLLMSLVTTVPANLNPVTSPVPITKKSIAAASTPPQAPVIPPYAKLDIAVFQALANFGARAEAALPMLFEMIKDGDYYARSEAARAIGKIARGNERIPPLGETLERCDGGTIANALRPFQEAGMNALIAELDTATTQTRQRVSTVFSNLPFALTYPFLTGALKNEDPKIRSGVAQTIADFRRNHKKGAISSASLPSPTLIDPLLAALKESVKDSDPDVRVLSAYSYQKAIDPDDGEIIERIASGLAHCSADNRSRGLIALDYYNLEKSGRKAAPALPVLIRLTSVDYSGVPAAKTLLHRIGISKDDIPVLVDALKEKSSLTRRAALRLIESLGPDAKDAVGPLIEMMADEEKGAKLIEPVLLAIGQEAVPQLIDAMKTTNLKIRYGVIQALSQMNLDGEWLGKIAGLLSDDRPELRSSAIALLSTSVDRAKYALPHLRDLLVDGDKLAYKARYDLFAVLGTEATQVLVDALKDNNPQARARAAAVLKPRGSGEPPREALKPLMALLADENVDVKAAALQTLGAYNENAAEIVPGLVEAMKDESTVLRRSALLYLKQHGAAAPAAALQALAIAMKDPTSKVRAAAIDATKTLGADAGPLLFEALGDPDHSVRALAASTLDALGLANEPDKKILIAEMFALDAIEQYAQAQEDHFIKLWDENRVHYYASAIADLKTLPKALAVADNALETPVPYNGFLFKMLEGQGAAAPGGAKKYVADGKMSQGHALAAFPAEYAKTGRFTFIVGDDGTIYKKDLGPESARLCGQLKELNPDETWTKFKVKPKDEGPVRFHPLDPDAADDMEF